MIRVADYIMDRLHGGGVDHVFMVTGRGALFLSDAVAGHENLKGISMHHEQAAAYAAVAYAQYNEKLGACLVSTGCAGTNAVTGVLNAWQDGVPCIFVSGQNKLGETSRHTGIPLRTYGQQEADIVSIVDSITKYAVMISDPKRIAYELDKALHLAQTGRKGPVWIDVPLDIQNMRVNPEELERFVPDDEHGYDPVAEDLQYLVDSIRSAERPAILIGNGVRSAGAIPGLEALVRRLEIPVASTASAGDVYGTANELSIGSAGTMGCSRAGNFTIQNADLLLVLGSRLSPMTTGSDADKFARAAKVVVVDIDPVEHSKDIIHIDRLIVADVGKVIASLLASDLGPVSRAWRDKCLHWKQVFPRCEDRYRAAEKTDLYYLSECLSGVMPPGAVLVCDSGLIEVILPTNVEFTDGQRCIHPVSQGAMGFALPGLVGAHYASGKPVLGVIGDGSVMMNLQEFETIRYQDIPAKVFVINNNAYAVIRKRQVEMFRNRTIGTDPSDGVGCPDFSKVANSFDIPYVRIDNSAELMQGLETVMRMEGPVLCEIMGLEDQEFIRSSHARNARKRIVRRPLEDQAPYLDRDLFLSEMIIEPIDQ